MMLIGQAPGVVEFENHIPFGGRAGRELFRWMTTINIDECEFRNRVYMAAITRCFPGKNPNGGGDRKPSRAEMVLCSTWLEAALHTLTPRAIILVGTLAIDRYLPRRSLEEIVGNRYETDGLTLIPLPHPSGASRWLNDLAHRDLLKQGLQHLRTVWDELAV
jgi:uracil-DNA glycosylase